MTRIKKKCDNCELSYNKVTIYKGKMLCKKCLNKIDTITVGNIRNGYSLEGALNKVYEVKGYLTKSNNLISMISFPQILIGHKFKIVLVE